MQKIEISPFKVIGVTIRTTNENGKSGQDIPELWNKCMADKVFEKIPNRIDTEVVCLYTNYASDHTKPYDTMLGCRVKSLDTIPEGMVGESFDGGNYLQFVSKGDLTKGAVYEKWIEIWNSTIERTFTADFELYGAKSQNPQDAEVDILIAVK